MITLFLCGFRFQARYDQHWAPVHPDEPTEGILTEIMLNPGEYFIQLNALSGWVIDALQFISNLQNHPAAGKTDVEFTKSVPLHGLLYFSGAAKDYGGIRVSKLEVHRETCDDFIHDKWCVHDIIGFTLLLLNSSAPGCTRKFLIFKLISRMDILPSGRCYKSSLMLSQWWLR